MKTKQLSRKRGSVLLVAIVVVLTVTLMVAALLQLSAYNQFETSYQLRKAQAHWLAEAGMERALEWLISSNCTKEVTINSSSSENLLGGMGSYQAVITWAPVSGIVRRYTVVATGTVSNDAIAASDTVRVQFEAAYGFPTEAFVALGGDSDIKATSATNIVIDGTI